MRLRLVVNFSIQEIEVTEGTAMLDNTDSDRAQALLRFACIRFAVDDCAGGYSNLARLDRLDFELRKISPSFLCDVGPCT